MLPQHRNTPRMPGEVKSWTVSTRNHTLLDLSTVTKSESVGEAET
jgi:hypothetical protein